MRVIFLKIFDLPPNWGRIFCGNSVPTKVTTKRDLEYMPARFEYKPMLITIFLQLDFVSFSTAYLISISWTCDPINPSFASFF